MDLNDCLDLELFDLSHFTTRRLHPLGYEFSDSFQQDKYYHNFLLIQSPTTSHQPLLQYYDTHVSAGFVVYRVEETAGEVDVSFLPTPPQIEYNGYYTASINHLNISTKLLVPSIEIVRVNESFHAPFYDMLYESNREYGEQFARQSANRIIPLLVDHQFFHYYVAKDGEKLVAMIRVYYHQNRAGIDDFYVLPTYRTKGIGSFLFHFVMNELQQKGIQEVALVADEEDTPKEMYQRFGFQRVGQFQMMIWKAKVEQDDYQ